MKKFLFAIATILLISFSAVAQDTQYDAEVEISETQGKLTYFAATSIDSIANGDIQYSQCMYYGDVNTANAYFTAYASEVGTEDINVSWEYSNDRSKWVAGTTPADLDSVGTTVVEDTVGTEAGAAEINYKAYNWIRAKFTNGQAQTAALTFTWALTFWKPAAVGGMTCGKTKDKI